MDNLDIEVLVAEVEQVKEKRGGRRPGAGRPSLVRENKKRMEMGLEPILPNKKINNKVSKRKSDAILPASKKARAQEVLAEMLGRKGKYIVQKVLDKALDDNDEDQMACLKLVMDRVLPADYLSKVKGPGNQIQINITGVGQEVEISNHEEDLMSGREEDIVDAEYEEEE